MNINLIMSEFGPSRINNGDSKLNFFSRLNPTLASVLNYFKDIKIILYTDFNFIPDSNIEVKLITDKLFDKNNNRYGNRCNDYYKVVGLLESDCDVAISLDADMFIYSDEIYSILSFAKKFGICIPANPRMLVKIDGIKGADANYSIIEDGSCGNGFAYNMSPIVFYTKNKNARILLEEYCKIMKENPARGPLNMWRAVWKTGINPYLLPFQWCVCAEHVAIGNEIILHIGHEKVGEYYKE